MGEFPPPTFYRSSTGSMASSRTIPSVRRAQPPLVRPGQVALVEQRREHGGIDRLHEGHAGARGDARGIDALGQAQAHQQRFARAVLR